MAPRAMWSGALSFGMVNIPVKLYAATHARDISFHLIHSTCGTRVELKRWCPTDEREVAWSEIVRGYEFTKGEHVILTDEDFEQLPLPSRHTIELTAFVAEQEIDPVFYERSYFLAPDARGEKPYALLSRVLQEKNLVALATITLRKKEQLCAVRPHRGTLLCETLYYRDEVELEREVDVSKVKITPQELEMAESLVELLRRPFDPAEYHDRYREALAELIEAKLEGKEIVSAPPRREAKVIDLADALARSVAAARKENPSRPKTPARRQRNAPARRRSRRPERKAG